MAKRKRTAMTTLDQISLGFVAVCAIGIGYLILVEPIRQRLHDDRRKKKNRSIETSATAWQPVQNCANSTLRRKLRFHERRVVG
jgi:hypothetical protein